MAGFIFLMLFLFVNNVLAQGVGSGTNGNLRVCMVEGRGLYKRAARFCPILERENSGIECVIGTDRLDCLRRMGKGTVDFGVFNPEDLVAAQWARLDVLVTNEIRTRPRQYERSIVAIVSRNILPEKPTSVRALLRNRTVCQSGLEGDEGGLSGTLNQYLESLVTDRSCNASLSLTENRILSLANYFGKACKAGSWVPDAEVDKELKSRYPSLCGACASGRCSTTDAFYGDIGALNCLALAGDVTWAEVHRAMDYFGVLRDAPATAPAAQHAYLCRDGSWQPIENNTSPCAWLERPWPVIVAKRKSSAAVGDLARSLSVASVTTDGHWHGALAALLEVNQAQPEPLQPPKALTDYLGRAKGFTEAYSQAGCTPSRHISICTTSQIERNKCEWLSEAALVFGIQPNAQCVLRDSKKECFDAIGRGDADVTLADPDWLVAAQRDYQVAPLLQETTPIIDQTRNVAAYVKKGAKIETFAELRGKRAAFGRFDGFAWHAVSHYLSADKNKCTNDAFAFFSEICAPGVERMKVSAGLIDRLTRNCYRNGDEVLGGERQALRALIEDKVDVAFVSMSAFKKFSGKPQDEAWASVDTELTQLCPPENKNYCLLSWSSLGHVYAPKNITSMRKEEIIDLFTKIDQLFGKNNHFRTPIFAMYGPYHEISDVLFHNNTKILTTNSILKKHPYDKMPLSFERDFSSFNFSTCVDYLNYGNVVKPYFIVSAVTLVALGLFR